MEIIHHDHVLITYNLWLASNNRSMSTLESQLSLFSHPPCCDPQVPTSCAQPKERFPTAHVTQLVQDFLASRLEGVCYGAGLSAGSLVLALSRELSGLVRTVCPPRYRLVCIVNLGPAGQEGLMLASRCLWDAHADTCISHTTLTAQVFCTATVFAVYNE